MSSSSSSTFSLTQWNNNNDNTTKGKNDNNKSGSSVSCNVDLNSAQLLQDSLPVRHGGPGIKSAQMLMPSAFLASAALTHSLHQSILPQSIASLEDKSMSQVETEWASFSGSERPSVELLMGQTGIWTPRRSHLVSSHRDWQSQTAGSSITALQWLAGCTAHHISGSVIVWRRD